MSEKTPAKFGQCQIKSKIGEGAMATVYLAEHTTLQIPVAVKVPRFGVHDDDDNNEHYATRFMREARIAARLEHPNIVRVYDAGEQEGHYFMVMAYVQGPTVKAKLEELGPMQWQEALRIGIDVSDALRYAAEQGVIHRDIKPDNIMINPKGQPQIMDLGLAKWSVSVSSDLTQTQDVLGTPYYMSPEQIVNPHKVDLRCDIYSLGATLYHMICGEPPYLGTSVYDVMNRHLRDPVASPKLKVPELPQCVCDMLVRMMAKEPAKRYQSYTDLIRDFNRALNGEQVVAGPSEDAPTAAEPVEIPPVQHPALARAVKVPPRAPAAQSPASAPAEKNPVATPLSEEQSESPAPQPPAPQPVQEHVRHPDFIPSTFLSVAVGLYGLVALLGLVSAGLVLFWGLWLLHGPVAAWGFALAALGGYWAYTAKLLRSPHGAANAELPDTALTMFGNSATWTSRALGIPAAKLQVLPDEKAACTSYMFSPSGMVIRVSRGFLSSIPQHQEIFDAWYLSEVGRCCYGYSTMLLLLAGPLRAFDFMVRPVCALLARASHATRWAHDALAGAAALGLVAIGTLVVLLLFVWLWAGIAAGMFLFACLLGHALSRHAAYAGDKFAARVLGAARPVCMLVASQTLRNPAEAQLLRKAAALSAASVQTPPSADQEEAKRDRAGAFKDPAETTFGVSEPTGGNGNGARMVVEQLLKEKCRCTQTGRLRELLAAEPAPALRINALAGLLPGVPAAHRWLLRALRALGNLTGPRQAPYPHPVAEPTRIRPYVTLGLVGGLLVVLGVFLLAAMRAESYLTFAGLVCLSAAAVGAADAVVFARKPGSRIEFSWSLIISAYCFMVCAMLLLALLGGSRLGPRGLIMPVISVPALACMAAAAALWVRLRRTLGPASGKASAPNAPARR